MVPLLRDGQLAQTLQRDGFVVLDAGLQAETEALAAYISHNFTLPASDFYYSLLANTSEQNLHIRDRIRSGLAGFYAAFLQDYRSVTESFLSKPPHTPGELLLHQDWCYTDETRHHAYNLWIPLVDVDETNGALFFLPGSQHWFTNLRSTTLPTARLAGTEGELRRHIVPVPLKRGQALVFHPAVFHGSFGNASARHRPVITATLMGAHAPFLHYHKEEYGVDVYELADDALLRHLPTLAAGQKPAGTVRQTLWYEHRPLQETDLLARLGQGL